MTMQWARNLILVGLAIVSYLMILAWQKDYGNTSPSHTPDSAVNRSVEASTPINLTSSTPVAAASTDIPTAPVKAELATATELVTAPTQGLLRVKTDVLDVQIDTVGGDIVDLSLPTYTKTVDGTEAFSLLENNRQRMFIAQSGLIGANGADANPEGRPVYQAIQSSFVLEKGKTVLNVPLTFIDKNGV